ncbi:MAG TPA: prepilin-type N-terminal cleavage/methylation domain-containing protein [Solirubrobacterales bacterium]
MKARLARMRSEEGFTLIELLVASAMGAVVMGAVAMLVISAVRQQPHISKQAQNITTARWALERMTREIRNGIVVKEKSASLVSFEGYVRHGTCGGSGSTSSSIKCRITYECTTTACFRKESEPNVNGGTARQIFSGIDSNQVFAYAPTEAAAPLITYVKITLRLPNPSGTGSLTVSDGTSLRNATLGY